MSTLPLSIKRWISQLHQSFSELFILVSKQLQYFNRRSLYTFYSFFFVYSFLYLYIYKDIFWCLDILLGFWFWNPGNMFLAINKLAWDIFKCAHLCWFYMLNGIQQSKCISPSSQLQYTKHVKHKFVVYLPILIWWGLIHSQ